MGKKMRYKFGMEKSSKEMGINKGKKIRYKFSMDKSSNENGNKSGKENSKQK